LIKVQYFHERHYYSEFNFFCGLPNLLLICLYLYPVDHCNFQTVIITTFYISDHWEEKKIFLSSYYLQIIWRWFLGQYVLLQLDTHPVKVFISPHFITAGNFPPETLVRNSTGWSCCHRMGHWNTPGHTQICWREVCCLSSRICKCLMFKRCQAKW